MISSLKIIDASTVLAGPSVGMFFAELGADVLKIENTKFPDVTRSWRTASESTETPLTKIQIHLFLLIFQVSTTEKNTARLI